MARDQFHDGNTKAPYIEPGHTCVVQRARLVTAICTLAIVVCLPAFACAQSPFYTDDAEVAARGRLHVESFDEYDWLPSSQSPHRQQNTFNMKVNYGLGRGLELDIDSPLLTIVNEPGTVPLKPVGFGDTNFGVKYQAREERHDSAWPALAFVTYVEVPTGDTTTGLGSGLVDTWIYGVLQKTLARDIVLHLNGGYLFTGNTSTGVVGITTARGHVATIGGSLVKKVSEAVTLGVDVTGAATRNADLNRAQLQAMLGGNYALRGDFTLDLGLIVGRFEASPRIGVLIGFSWDVPK